MMKLNPENLEGKKLSDFTEVVDVNGLWLAAFKKNSGNYFVNASSYALKSNTYTKPETNAVMQQYNNNLVSYINDRISEAVSAGIKGEANPATMPEGVGFEVYNVSEAGAYSNFKDATGTAIVISQADLDSGFVQLWGQDDVWEKKIVPISLSGYITKADVVNDLETSDPERPLGSTQAAIIVDKINAATKIPTYEDAGATILSNRSVECNTGALKSNSSYEACSPIQVEPGSYISYTGVVAGIDSGVALGIAGYDQSLNFLSQIDSHGLPIGNLYGKDRYAIETSTSPNASRLLLTDKMIKIPEGCYFIRACSAIAEAVPGDLVSPLTVKTPHYNSESETVIDKINQIEDDIPQQVSAAEAKINAQSIVSITDRITNTNPKVTVYKDSVSYPGGVVGGICLAVQAMLIQPNEGPFYVLRSDINYSQTYNITPDPNMVSNYGVFLDLDVMLAIAEPITSSGYVPVDIMHEGLFVTKDMNSKTDYKKSNQLLLMQYYYGEYLYSPYFGQKIADFLSGGGSGGSVNGFELMQDEVEDIAFANSFYRDESNVLQKRFTFAHISDIHPNSLNALKNTDAAISFTKRAKIGQQLKALICTGDICNGNAGRDKTIALGEMRSVVNRLTDSGQGLLSCTLIGNHDTNVNEASSNNPSGSYTQAINKEEQYNELIKPFADRFPELQTQSDKCYFYFDFPDDKIRFIALDSYDYEAAPDATDPTKLYYKVGFIYSQDQIDWLYDTLNSTPSDYGLIVLTHGPHVPDWTVGYYRQGTDFIPSVIKAYKEGSSYTHNWDGAEYPEYATSKVFDFTSKGPSEVIMWICGHAHTRKIINYMDVNVIQAHCLFTDEDVFVAGHTKTVDSIIPKRSNTATESSFNIYSIDRNEKKIYLTCYGAFRDDKGEFNNREVVIQY